MGRSRMVPRFIVLHGCYFGPHARYAPFVHIPLTYGCRGIVLTGVFCVFTARVLQVHKSVAVIVQPVAAGRQGLFIPVGAEAEGCGLSGLQPIVPRYSSYLDGASGLCVLPVPEIRNRATHLHGHHPCHRLGCTVRDRNIRAISRAPVVCHTHQGVQFARRRGIVLVIVIRALATRVIHVHQAVPIVVQPVAASVLRGRSIVFVVVVRALATRVIHVHQAVPVVVHSVRAGRLDVQTAGVHEPFQVVVLVLPDVRPVILQDPAGVARVRIPAPVEEVADALVHEIVDKGILPRHILWIAAVTVLPPELTRCHHVTLICQKTEVGLPDRRHILRKAGIAEIGLRPHVRTVDMG